jgi:mRNA-degrading endonuclease RelE of RelBE toxin-antitoxin system
MTDSGKTSEETPAPKYEVVFTEDARSDVGALDGSVKKQLAKVSRKKIAVNPEGYGTPLRAPLSGYWKHEFANHRLIYQILPEDKKIVVICAVGPRKGGDVADIYFQLNRVAESGRLAEQVTSILETILPGLKRKKKK